MSYPLNLTGRSAYSLVIQLRCSSSLELTFDGKSPVNLLLGLKEKLPTFRSNYSLHPT